MLLLFLLCCAVCLPQHAQEEECNHEWRYERVYQKLDQTYHNSLYRCMSIKEK